METIYRGVELGALFPLSRSGPRFRTSQTLRIALRMRATSSVAHDAVTQGRPLALERDSLSLMLWSRFALVPLGDGFGFRVGNMYTK